MYICGCFDIKNMNTKNIKNKEDLKLELARKPVNYLLLYKAGAAQSECALSNLKDLDMEVKGLAEVLIADVTLVRDIHPEYNIESVPSLLKFSNDRLITIYKGCNGKEFYHSVFSGERSTKTVKDEKPAKRITVYSTSSCSWCTTLKNYLRENKIVFTDIDVASDQKAAEEMVRKSGQQGVPQTDINGEIIIGFDKTRIDRLLEIGR